MMRIATITAHFPNLAHPTDGRSAYQILRCIARKAELKIFCPMVKYPSKTRPLGTGHRRVNPGFVAPADLDVQYIDYLGIPFLSRPFNGWTIARAVLPHVRAFAPDLITSYVLYPDGFAAVEIGKALSVPVIVKGVGSDVHNIPDRIALRHTRTVFRDANLITMVSEDLRKKALELGAPPEKTLTILNGCDKDVFHPTDKVAARIKLQLDPEAEIVVYVGRMDVRKGLRELVEASAALHRDRPRYRAFLVGEGPDRPIIDEAIRAHNASSFIHTMGGCAFDDVAIWNAAADLVTLPSYMEGYPNSVLEAVASGRPVVATDVGGIPEIVDNRCGRLIPPKDAIALAGALAAVLDQDWDAKLIAESGARSWPDVALQLLGLYEKVVSDYKTQRHER